MSHFIMYTKRRHTWKKRRPKKRQKGGILPLAAIAPFLAAGGKAAALGAPSAAAEFGTKKALEAATRKRNQSGGAMLRPKKRLADKIAEGASMFLSGPAPSFATIGLKLAGQAAKRISDNVAHYRTEEGDKLPLIHDSKR